MKTLVTGILRAVMGLIRRFQSANPASAYEQIAFNAVRSALAVAFFPAGVTPGGVHADR